MRGVMRLLQRCVIFCHLALGRSGCGVFGRRKRSKVIPVRPKNYRSICLRAIETSKEPHVYFNGKEVSDFSEQGSLTQRALRECRDFAILDGKEHVLGFHDHPDQMGISAAYEELALFCEAQGWLKVEGPSS
jgi:hypothetical protein